MNEFISSKEATRLLHITPKTLRLWASQGKIHFVRTPSGQRRYDLSSIQHVLGGLLVPAPSQKACYCRVSSSKQMDDLDRQKHFLQSRFPNHLMVTDIASGINWKRKGLQTLLDLAMRGHLSEIMVAHRDRLCRFAFELLEWIFSQLKVTLVVLDHEDSKSHDTELADDLLSIIHVYSCRQMGRRRYLHKKNKDLSHPKTEDHAQTMDGDKTIRVQSCS